MSDRKSENVRAFLQRSREAMVVAESDAAFVASIDALASRVATSMKAGGKLMLAGNGGSAADAQHIATEFVVRFVSDRDPLPALALTTDTSALTAIGNDYGYEQVFARQVRALGRPGDVFIGISTSGSSANILSALKAARDAGVITVGLTRAGTTAMHSLCDIVIGAPSDETAVIQQLHITALHALCIGVESELFGLSHGRPT